MPTATPAQSLLRTSSTKTLRAHRTHHAPILNPSRRPMAMQSSGRSVSGLPWSGSVRNRPMVGRVLIGRSCESPACRPTVHLPRLRLAGVGNLSRRTRIQERAEELKRRPRGRYPGLSLVLQWPAVQRSISCLGPQSIYCLGRQSKPPVRPERKDEMARTQTRACGVGAGKLVPFSAADYEDINKLNHSRTHAVNGRSDQPPRAVMDTQR